MKSLIILIAGCSIAYAVILYYHLNSFTSLIMGILIGIMLFFEKGGEF